VRTLSRNPTINLNIKRLSRPLSPGRSFFFLSSLPKLYAYWTQANKSQINPYLRLNASSILPVPFFPLRPSSCASLISLAVSAANVHTPANPHARTRAYAHTRKKPVSSRHLSISQFASRVLLREFTHVEKSIYVQTHACTRQMTKEYHAVNIQCDTG
jgi:hypothetical protein